MRDAHPVPALRSSTARPVLVALAVIGFAASLTSAARTAAPPVPGIAFDQVARYLNDATPPPPDSFATDAARIAALPQLPDPSGVIAALERAQALGPLSVIPGAGLVTMLATIAAAKASEAYSARLAAIGKAYAEAGAMSHVALYHGWSRIDFAGHHATVIARPGDGVTFDLDDVHRTYRTVNAPSQPAEDTYVVSAADDVRIAVDTPAALATAPAMTLAGTAARGYAADVTFTIATQLGACAAGKHALHEIEYVADVPDPQTSPGPDFDGTALVRDACIPSATGSHREPGRLVIFRSTAVSGAGTPFARVIERGNVRELGSGDESLFFPPGTYTEDRRT